MRLRALVSLLLPVVFLVLSCSGAVLYITPQGRVANWTGWTLLGLSKNTWQALHTAMALLLVLAVLLHLWLNWNILWGYIKAKARPAINCKWELLAALLLTTAAVLAAVYNVPPVSTLMEWNSRIKAYWERTAAGVPPPVQHAEELTLGQLAAAIDVALDELTDRLAQSGITVDNADQTLAELALQHGITPRDLYAKITALFPDARWTGRGAGLGKGPGLGKGADDGKAGGTGQGFGAGKRAGGGKGPGAARNADAGQRQAGGRTPESPGKQQHAEQ